MKRIIASLLCLSLLLVGCTRSETKQNVSGGDASAAQKALNVEQEYAQKNFKSLDDENLLRYVEDLVYRETITSLNNDGYFVENVSAVYISKEYLEEVAFNSQSNIYFGYTLAELDELFQGSRYIFTLGEDGNTTVQELQVVDDTSTNTILKNVAIGTGVVLVCVTVSAVSAGAGAPAVAMIFAASAKTGAIMALSSGAMGGISAGIITGIKTGDFKEAAKSAALAGSEGFKWGAISGAVSGGAAQGAKYAKAMQALKGQELVGFTKQQAAAIQMKSGYPVDVIKQLIKPEQYEILKNGGLKPVSVNGKTALVRDIDLKFKDEFGRTNLERMRKGLAALDPATGKAYQLHHIGQKADSTLAILTEAEHMKGGNNGIWHELGKATEVHGPGSTWDAQREAFWKAISNNY